ncbi:hypothetical protein FM120_07115 [Sphingobacterium faecium PCAi_F2.5]|nr:hypothetical protein FM120_07115 [Sphingobacterium faecium PCAi_F2.5]
MMGGLINLSANTQNIVIAKKPPMIRNDQIFNFFFQLV